MWKKDEETAEPQARQKNAPESRGESPRSSSAAREPATIGPSITIDGEVSGDEDLLIQGQVNGSVELAEQSVTVGRDGRVKAHITGRIVTIEGEVEGDLKAEEQIVLRASARVEGDITAPRVVLEDGARFRGLVDMGEAAKQGGGRRGDRTGMSGRVTPEPMKSSSPSSPSTGSTSEEKEDESDKTESVKASS